MRSRNPKQNVGPKGIRKTPMGQPLEMVFYVTNFIFPLFLYLAELTVEAIKGECVFTGLDYKLFTTR